ncbi:MAG: crotonase/enoyl-CoA hydratase family protein [Deltaproteobacteria bacterium]|nr:crotonase/enoyl-CoA hydratase family protein [Deltaproteobacteria bacterium]
MEKVTYSIEDGIAQITMDDGKANAMDWGFFEEMGKSMDQAENDGAKALVITGRPGFFSGGLDLKLLPTLSASEMGDFTTTLARTMLRVFSFPVPTIAACTGHAIAGGAMLTFACDRRFALDGPYRIQMNETLIGIALPSWMFLIARSAISSRWRNEALLHARAYNPNEALERGILDAVAKDTDSLAAQVKTATAETLSLNLPAYAASKKKDLLKKELSDQG